MYKKIKKYWKKGDCEDLRRIFLIFAIINKTLKGWKTKKKSNKKSINSNTLLEMVNFTIEQIR